MVDATERERVAVVFFYGFLALLAYLVFGVFKPFLASLGWAAVLVVVFYPWYVRLERRWGATRAALSATVSVTLILIVPAVLVMAAFVNQGFQAARALQQVAVTGHLEWLDRGWSWLTQRVPGASQADLTTLARQGAERIATVVAAKLGTALRNLALFLFDLFVTTFALFYLFRDGRSIMDGLRRVLPFGASHREQMIEQTRDLIFASVTSSLVVAGVHGLLGGVAFALVGIGSAVFWGVVMGFSSLVPLVGAWVIWLPAAIWLIVQGHLARGIILVAICGAAVLGVENLLRPALIGGRARLNGLIVFISVVGGIEVFGMLGVVLGPIVVAMAAGLVRAYSRVDAEEAGFVRPQPRSSAGTD